MKSTAETKNCSIHLTLQIEIKDFKALIGPSLIFASRYTQMRLSTHLKLSTNWNKRKKRIFVINVDQLIDFGKTLRSFVIFVKRLLA